MKKTIVAACLSLLSSAALAVPDVCVEECLFRNISSPLALKLFAANAPEGASIPRGRLTLYIDCDQERPLKILASQIEAADGLGNAIPVRAFEENGMYSGRSLPFELDGAPKDGHILIKGHIRISLLSLLEPVETQVSFSEASAFEAAGNEISLTPLSPDQASSVWDAMKRAGTPDGDIHFMRVDVKGPQESARIRFTGKDGSPLRQFCYDDERRDDSSYAVFMAFSSPEREMSVVVTGYGVGEEMTLPVDIHITTAGQVLKGKGRPSNMMLEEFEDWIDL